MWKGCLSLGRGLTVFEPGCTRLLDGAVLRPVFTEFREPVVLVLRVLSARYPVSFFVKERGVFYLLFCSLKGGEARLVPCCCGGESISRAGRARTRKTAMSICAPAVTIVLRAYT